MSLSPLLKKYGSLFILSFVLGFFIPKVFSPYLQTNIVNPYAKAETWEEAVVAYHVDANAITNLFLEELLDADDPNVSFPGGPEGCNGTNRSTYCLAVALNDQLHLLELDLLDRSEEIEFITETESSPTIDDAFNQVSVRRALIDTEMEAARDTLDLNLAVYNQVQLVYPLHIEMDSLIENLEDFRDNLAAVRDVVTLFPGRFHDATTLHCK